MSEPLYRLLAWLSPAYPIGAFSYSHGIETAVEEGLIKDRVGLVAWLESVRASAASFWRAVSNSRWAAASLRSWWG